MAFTRPPIAAKIQAMHADHLFPRHAAAPTPAGHLRGISSMAMRPVLTQLAALWAQRSGGSGGLDLEAVGGVEAARRVQAGEAFDVVFLASQAIDKLAASGQLDARSKRDLAHSGVAVAVQAGAPWPDVSTPEAVRLAVLGAPSLSYSTGPSGVALQALFEGWGIFEAVKARIQVPPPGTPVGALLAQGAVALGFQQHSELMGLAGIAVLGPLPPEIQIKTTFSAACCAHSSQTHAVQALLEFMTGPEAAAVIRQHGMDAA